ncbi:helix-turn-helix domain-containing protein [Liquorilactobacillus satsumensis]|uniref:helix-turn-helix domain-containing protein n=1 Tax=Liquorilactobacillus satsumensis TaxID=259059 RepID=UPI0039EC5767
MQLYIGPVLTAQRKQKGITQQQLADFIGVSKAAVSKWETGQTYPDITLLPALAAYFDLRIDDLLNYQPQLSAKEIQTIYAALKTSFETETAEEVLRKIHSFVRRYYACYPFIQQMGLLLLNHYDLLPGKDEPEKLQHYVSEAKDLFIHVFKNAKELTLIKQANDFAGYAQLMLGNNEEVFALLGRRTPACLPVENLIAAAFQRQNNLEAAQAIYQSSLFQYLTIMVGQFCNYLQVLLNEPKRFAQTYQHAQDITHSFHFETLHPVAMMNLQLSAAAGFAQQRETTALFEVLTEFVSIFTATKFPVKLHGDRYFDLIDDWLEHLDIGSQLPRDPAQVQSSLKNFVLQGTVFAPYKDDPRMIALCQQLKKPKNYE